MFFLLFSYQIFAQQTEVENMRTIPKNPGNSRTFLDEFRGVTISGDRRKTSLQSQPISQNSTKGQNEINSVTLTINLAFDMNQEIPSMYYNTEKGRKALPLHYSFTFIKNDSTEN